MTSTQPSPPPTTAALAAADDLTALAAELNQRGHPTRLTPSPPHLTPRPPSWPCPSASTPVTACAGLAA